MNMYSNNFIKKIEGGKRFDDVSGCERNIPLITYITVVLNSEKTINRTIQSVLNQSFRDFEYIIVDGGSSDGTLDIILNSKNKIDYFISEKDSGIYNAFNKAISLARGSIICIVNADDWLEPDAAMIAADLLTSHSELTVLFTAAVVRDDLRGSRVWIPQSVSAGSYFTCANVCHNGMYAKRCVYDVVGMYNENYKIAGDFEWIMRCLEYNINFIYSDKITVNYSVGGMSSDVKKHRNECISVSINRFPFLSRENIEDLFVCYFDSIDSYNKIKKYKYPIKRIELLEKLIHQHCDHPDFVQSMAWASIEKLIHPSDVSFALSFKFFLLPTMIHLKKLLFTISPALFRFIKNISFRSCDNKQR